jgi:CheY-like chemotaxis protein
MEKSILLLDDDEDDLCLLQELITELDGSLCCLSFTCPQEALKYFKLDIRHNIPDFILTDLSMPKLSGIEFISKLRSERVFENTIIAALSTTITDDIERSLHKNGADYVFEKPRTINGYFEMLNLVLHAERTGS